MPSRIPNLFVVGAPKCGTTSMSHYLASHPQIFMTEQVGVKEPHYFLDEFYVPERSSSTLDGYLELFNEAPMSAAYLGEASVFYLYSEHAIPKILELSPDARLIAMIRNPVDMAVSLHNQHLKHGDEIVDDFEKAWRLQEARARGDLLPKRFSDGTLFQYGPICRVGIQLRRLLELVPPNRLHIVVFDDLVNNPTLTCLKLLDFLNITTAISTPLPRKNPSVSFSYRFAFVERALQEIRWVREWAGISGNLGIHQFVNRFNRIRRGKPISSKFEAELIDYFSEDVQLLEQLLCRQLDMWSAGGNV